MSDDIYDFLKALKEQGRLHVAKSPNDLPEHARRACVPITHGIPPGASLTECALCGCACSYNASEMPLDRQTPVCLDCMIRDLFQ